MIPQPKRPSKLRASARPAATLAAVMALAAIGQGCALGMDGETPKTLVKECVLPTDQARTLAGRWRVAPIPIAFHAGSNWGSDEISDIVKAADTWNDFYAATQGYKVLDYGSASAIRSSAQPVPTDVCSQGLVQGNSFTGQVVIYKHGKWPHASGAQSTIALTNFCTTAATPLSNIYMAYMEVNYEYFFVQGRQVPDLRTIMAHEFGHLLGLYHSCDRGSTKTGTPDCMKNLKPDYRSALMFPVFGFNSDGSGEQKRSLGANDQGRANCLYPASGKTSTGSTQ